MPACWPSRPPFSAACRTSAQRVTPPTAGALHLESFLEMLAAERNASAHTLRAYRRDLEDLAGFVAKRGPGLAETTGDDVRAYLKRMSERGLSPRTGARRLSALRQFHRFLVAEGLRADDPLMSIDAPRLGRPLPKTLSETEVKRLIEAAPKLAMPEPERVRLTAMIEVFYAAGLRVSEVAALPVAALARDGRFLTVRGKCDQA